MQARALGAAAGDLADLRALLRSTQRIQRYEPTSGTAAWAAAAARLENLRLARHADASTSDAPTTDASPVDAPARRQEPA